MSNLNELLKNIWTCSSGVTGNDCGFCRGPDDNPQAPNPECPVCRGTGVYPTKILALIASKGGLGAVLEHNGALWYDLEESGLSTLEDLGFSEAPDGLSIFEGKYRGGEYDSHNGDYNDTWPDGDFRELTPAEWDAVKEKRQVFPTITNQKEQQT